MIALELVQSIIDDVKAAGPATLLTVGAFAGAVAWNLKETIAIGKKLTKVCERFTHTPTTAFMQTQISGETRRMRDEVTDIVGDVQMKNFELADEVEAIKIECARRHGGEES